MKNLKKMFTRGQESWGHLRILPTLPYAVTSQKHLLWQKLKLMSPILPNWDLFSSLCVFTWITSHIDTSIVSTTFSSMLIHLSYPVNPLLSAVSIVLAVSSWYPLELPIDTQGKFINAPTHTHKIRNMILLPTFFSLWMRSSLLSCSK